MTILSRNEHSHVMTVLAKALYDNLADAPDELSFRKGDIVTVIEQDVDGLVGWWLCLLHGRQGIVPGNRLDIIPPFDVDHGVLNEDSADYDYIRSSKYDRGVDYDTLPTPVKAQHGEIYDSPGPLSVKDLYNIPIQHNDDLANKFNQMKFTSPKSVAEQTANVTTASDSFRSPHDRSPEEYYDHLPNTSLHDQSDYDFPVSKFSNQKKGYIQEGVYDQFPTHVSRPLSPRLLLSEDIYKIPTGFDSKTSPVTPEHPNQIGTLHYKQPRNIPYQQNGTPHQKSPVREDIYDSPPNKQNGLQNSAEDIYNVPPSHQDIYNVPPSSQDIYSVPPPAGFGSEPVKSGLTSVTYATPPQQNLSSSHQDNTLAQTKPLNNDVVNNNHMVPSQYTEEDYMDYQDIYGAEPPPGMTKSPVTSRSASPTQQFDKPVKKSVLEQINMDAVRELNITQKEAFDRLGKLHVAVDTSVSTLLEFTEGEWLSVNILKANIGAIRDLSSKCKTALRLLTEFGLGSLINVKKRQNKNGLENKIIAGLEPLLECYYKIKICLLHLDSNDWVVPSERNPTTDKFFATVNAIMILIQRIPELCTAFAGTIHLNVGLLFDRELQQQQQPHIPKTVDVGPIPSTPDITPPSPAIPPPTQNPFERPVMDNKAQIGAELRRRSSSNTSNDLNPLIRDRQQSRKKSMEIAQSQTLRRPHVPPKPALPDQRKSMINYQTLPNARLSQAENDLVTEFIPESPRRKCASDPLSSPTEQEGDKTMWGGSWPSLERRKSEAPALHSSSTGSVPMTLGATPVQAAAKPQPMRTETSYAGKQASDPNLLSNSPQGSLQYRSTSLPQDGKAAVFPSYAKQQSNTAPVQKNDNNRVPKLDHRDIETLDFFCRQVESQVIILREAVRNLTESVENLDPPKKFVSHSKFVILTAHKVVHAGEESNERIMNANVRKTLKQCILELTASIRSVVASTKQAALQYPNRAFLSDMTSTILSVGECVRNLHIEIRKALDM